MIACHGSGGAGFIDKEEPLGSDGLGPLSVACPKALDSFGVLFARYQCLFLRVNRSFASPLLMVEVPTEIPVCSSKATASS